ncbi:MAG: helix-turn-helix transcriptional regulator [Chloroflexi bacterium]|nr:helix-turn-helix transcriptional regulator [Chloroflexota bacterium]
MTYKIDFSIASSSQIEIALGNRIENIRLSRNITQAKLADEAGVALRTISRLEKGQNVSLDTFIRVLIALGIQHNLSGLLPDPSVRPIERVNIGGTERKRARANKSTKESGPWSWGDGIDDEDS